MRKIALVGTAGSAAAAPVDDLSYEIWGVSARSAHLTRADRWFELHRLDGEPADWAAMWRETVKGFIEDVPLYMLYPEPALAKNVVPYPAQEMMARFGSFFMTSTFSWMMAMAIHELRPTRFSKGKGDEIFICGVEMEAGSEYAQQRAGFRHFFQTALELGITVTRLGESGLSYEPIPYPMWQDDPMLCKLELRKKETVDHLQVLEKTLLSIKQSAADVSGRMEGILWHGVRLHAADQAVTDQEIARLDQTLQQLKVSSSDTSKSILHHQGGLEQIQWMLNYLQP